MENMLNNTSYDTAIWKVILNKEQIKVNKDKLVCHKNRSRLEQHFAHSGNDHLIEMDSQIYCVTKENIKGYG